jgi:hypothetical protein
MASSSRGITARGLHKHSPSKKERAGNAGRTLHPRPRVQIAQRNAHTSIQVQRRHSGIPCAMALRLMARSPRQRIPFCHRRLRIDDPACPGRARNISADLTSATDARTTRFCRTRLRRSSCAPVDRSRETRPAIPFRADAAASTASPPAFVTIAIRPSYRERTGRTGSADLPDGLSEIFLREGLDDPNQLEMFAKNRLFAHRIFNPI